MHSEYIFLYIYRIGFNKLRWKRSNLKELKGSRLLDEHPKKFSWVDWIGYAISLIAEIAHKVPKDSFDFTFLLPFYIWKYRIDVT